MNRRLSALVVYGTLGYFAAFLVGVAWADEWLIVKEKQIAVGSCMAKRFRIVEQCARLGGPLPRLARVAPEPCATEPDRNCLPGGLGGAYDHERRMVFLPQGNSRWLEHEAVHHLLYVNGDPRWREHDRPEWACE